MCVLRESPAICVFSKIFDTRTSLPPILAPSAHVGIATADADSDRRRGARLKRVRTKQRAHRTEDRLLTATPMAQRLRANGIALVGERRASFCVGCFFRSGVADGSGGAGKNLAESYSSAQPFYLCRRTRTKPGSPIAPWFAARRPRSAVSATRTTSSKAVKQKHSRRSAEYDYHDLAPLCFRVHPRPGAFSQRCGASCFLP